MASSTVSVKVWWDVPDELVAVNVIEKVPPVPAAGVPLSVPLPVPPVKATPLGRAPDSVMLGVGVPVAVIVNVPLVPTVNVVLLAVVNTGALFTVSVKLWVAGVPTPLLAVNVMEYVPAVPDAGVPLRVPVPSPLSLKVTPLGSGGVLTSLNAGFGKPVVMTVNEPEAPTVKVVALRLVMAGASSTVSVKLCIAGEPTPFDAVNVMG